MVAFSTAVNAIGTVGNFFSSKAANKFNQKMQKYYADVEAQAYRDQQAQAAFNAQMGAYMLALQQEQDREAMDLFRQRNLSQQELQRYLRGFDVRNEARLTAEIDRLMDRQGMVDEFALEDRMRELERQARDDRLSFEERQMALEDLRLERQRARRQREQEQARIDRFDDQYFSEFEERRNRLLEDRAIRNAERELEVRRSDDVINQATATRDRMRNVLNQVGTLTTPELLGQEEIDRRSRGYEDAFMAQVNAAMDRTLSQKEAELIRRGMDQGGSANAQRAEILARLAPSLVRAQAEANRAAAGEVGAENKMRQDRFNNLRTQLLTQLKAEQDAGLAGLNLAANLTAPRTSAVLDRDIGSGVSAYTIGGPATNMYGIGDLNRIDSAITSPLNISSGYGSLLSMPNMNVSGSTNAGYYDGSMGQNTYDPYNYFNLANTGINNLYNNASANLTSANETALASSKAYGENKAELFDLIGSAGDYIQDNYFGVTPKQS